MGEPHSNIYLIKICEDETVAWTERYSFLLKSSILWNVMPYNLVEVYWCFRGTYCLHFRGQRVCQPASSLHAAQLLAYCLTLKMEPVHFSDVLEKLYQTTRRHIPENRTFHNHCCKNLEYQSYWLLCYNLATLALYGVWFHAKWLSHYFTIRLWQC
jgi:hypothetical protein